MISMAYIYMKGTRAKGRMEEDVEYGCSGEVLLKFETERVK